MSSAMRRAERVRVPLNAMCSMRWLSPLSSGRSWRDPAPTQTPSVAVATPGIFSVATVTPLSNVVMRRPGEAAWVAKCWFMRPS